MSRSSARFEDQPLAVQLACERFRQHQIAGLLAGMNIDPTVVSEQPGGEILLAFSPSAFRKLKEESAPGLLDEELLEEIRADLNRRCRVDLERDITRGNPFLDIKTERWILRVLPAKPAWVVHSVRSKNSEMAGQALFGLPWRLVLAANAPSDASPLPLWFLSLATVRAKVGDAKQQFKIRGLLGPSVPSEQRAEAARFQRMCDELPAAMQDLCAALRLLQWEHERRPRLSWTITLTPLVAERPEVGPYSYLIQNGRPDAWQRFSIPLALGVEPTAPRVYAAADPDISGRWLLHSKTTLPLEITVFEMPFSAYAKQSKIAERLADYSKICPENAAVAAMQIDLPTTSVVPSEFHPLPGEAKWEPRQEDALRLALAGHPVCAIKGPPGTGKTTVIVGIIRRAIHAGQSVLLVAPTHVALDVVLGRVHELRQKNIEHLIVPARVAPAEESKIEPDLENDLEKYLVHNLGRNLARKSLHDVREQLKSLPLIEHLNEMIRKGTETAAHLRNLALEREHDAKARQNLLDLSVALMTASELKQKRQSALASGHSALQHLQHQDTQLTEATRQYDEIALRLFRAKNMLMAAEQTHSDRQAGLNHAGHTVSRASEAVEQALRELELRIQAEWQARPGDWWGGRLWENIFSAHAAAVESVNKARVQLATSQSACSAAEQAVPLALAKLNNAESALHQARQTMAEVNRELHERLAPMEDTIVSALAENGGNWFSMMPDSLRKAAGATREGLQSYTRAYAQLKIDQAKAEEGERAANVAHDAAQGTAESAQSRLLALEQELCNLRIAVSDDLSSQIVKIEYEQTARDRQLELIIQRRKLLQRWIEFYAHEAGTAQITAWALNSVNLVAATTQGIAGSKEFKDRIFDLVICDESSRVTRGEILVPADRAATRIVLVGDEKQLPPYVETDDEQFLQALAAIHLSESRAEVLPEMVKRLCEAWNIDEPEFRPVRVEEVCKRARTILDGGKVPSWPRSTTKTRSVEERLRAWRNVADTLTVSCFDHLLGLLPPKRVVRLSVQRRMVADIANLVSEPVYNGDYQSPSTSSVAPLLTQAFRHAWVFVNTRSYCAARPEFFERRQGTGFINEGEARAVVLALKQHLTSARRAGKPVILMVVTFYLAQARLIETMVSKTKELRQEHIPILPIDRCQGQEADAVVVSFVRTQRAPRANAGRWLQDVRRLNVAFTRARHSLVLIGNLQTLTALRGDADGERFFAHLGRCVVQHPDRQIEQLHGL